jgi:GNAT superfamily N-acetyltransferase
VNVRDAGPGDGEALSRLWVGDALYYVELFPEDFRVPNLEGLAEDLEKALARERDPSRLWLVAELDGEVVGQLGAHVEPPMDNADRQMLPYLGRTRLFIDSLGTAKTHWRRGVGAALVEAAEEWGRDKGATVAILDTYIHSPVSVPFWQERMHYSPRAIIFQKSLD